MSDLLLPKDIQVEIFLKLQLNSILTCKCVCKPWRQLICSREFVKYHLNRSIQANNHKVIVSRNHRFFLPGVYSLDYVSISKASSQSFPWNESEAINFPFQDNKRFDCVEILGSCDGLICLHMSGASLGYENTIIWNPSTREYKKVPEGPELSFELLGAIDATRYGFGYDYVRDDYKLVKININSNRNYSCSNIQVYKLGSDSWNSIGTTRYSFPHETKSDGLLFNGALHWLGVIQGTSIEVIVFFDVSNDKMVDIELPAVPMSHPEAEQYKNLGVLEDCLCLVFVVPNVRIDVWAMMDCGVRESWTKQFTIIQNADCAFDFPFWMPILVLKNGDILADTTWESVICDPKVGRTRKVCRSIVGRWMMESASYVESLVSLNSGNHVQT